MLRRYNTNVSCLPLHLLQFYIDHSKDVPPRVYIKLSRKKAEGIRQECGGLLKVQGDRTAATPIRLVQMSTL